MKSQLLACTFENDELFEPIQADDSCIIFSFDKSIVYLNIKVGIFLKTWAVHKQRMHKRFCRVLASIIRFQSSRSYTSFVLTSVQMHKCTLLVKTKPWHIREMQKDYDLTYMNYLFLHPHCKHVCIGNINNMKVYVLQYIFV